MNKYYAGIGARATPEYTLGIFTCLALMLDKMGFTLRSGGANGADMAFERGLIASSNKEIYLPWKNFNHSHSELYTPSTEAYTMAERFHPNWTACSSAARSFHARNCHQILGKDLKTPVTAVVCWTPEGKVTGGTGQALRIALDKKIPIFNFGHYVDKSLALFETHHFFEGERP